MTKCRLIAGARRHVAAANMLPRLLIVAALTSGVLAAGPRAQWRPCVELKRDLLVQCGCAVSASYPRSLEMNCDRVVFTRDTADLLRGQPIVAVSQRHCGHQSLPEDLINAGLGLRALDLSGNAIHRLMDRVLQAQTGLRELRLADNLLGDSLNPIFSSNEFHGMAELEVLDLSRNGLRSLEEGIFKGCASLQELYLDGNNLTAVPTASLKGLRIEVLSLAGNNIGSLPRGSFTILGESLLRLDLSGNELSHIDDGAFSGVQHLLFLNISRNSLSRFNSDVFKGAFSLLQLDLSANFLQEFPTDALRHLVDLRYLNISNNLIGEIERMHLASLTELQVLDLSRNNIGRLEVNTFSSLSALTRLDLSLNALRTIEESAFEGLTRLKWLSLRDNNILLVPASAFTRLPSLIYLHVEFNRVAALSVELIRATSANLITLGLTRNLVREIPPRLFHNFKNLLSVELSGNMLSAVQQNAFAGLEDTLLNLDLSHNRLTTVSELPLKNLLSLNLAGNQLRQISPETFGHLDRLQYLNLSGNPLYGGFPPVFPPSLIGLDVSRTRLKILPAVLLLNLASLERISLAGNQLEEIDEGTFQHLYNLTAIDLSYNAIGRIDAGAFVGLINLHTLSLRGNRLTSFVGEHFNTGTGLEVLDLAENRIAQLSPTAFVIHPRLRRLDLSDNRFAQFPSDFVKSLQFLEWLDLSGNALHHVGEFAFSQMNRLRNLNLSGNKIELVDDLAFHNSTQLQLLDLSGNVLEGLSERTMEGLLRLEFLDLRDNQLASLPETVFDPSRIRALEKLDLSGNRFNEIPVRALHRQAASLLGLSVARNRIAEVLTQDVINSVKELDLSGNPLSEGAIRGVLGEVKVLRALNLAGAGIRALPRLETPFLRHLNVSGNAIADIKPATLERATMLETLDVSGNRLTDLTNLVGAFKVLPALRRLDVSGNEIRAVNESSFDGLGALRSLGMASLPNCTRIERSAFRSLKRLRALRAYDYPKLGYFDVQGILRDMASLEVLDVEIKDSSVGNEQLSLQTHPRLRELTLRGERLRSVLSSSLVGVRGPRLLLGLRNTSVDTIPTALFFPVPRSTRIELDLSGSRFASLPAQLLAALDERGGAVAPGGLANNPISCDCEAKHLWRWLRLSATAGRAPTVLCAGPEHLAGALLANLTEEFLSCATPTMAQTVATTTSTTRSTTSEPQIIWTVAPTTQNSRNKHYNNDHTSVPSVGSISSTEDTLIIGIVGGVVAFIAIIVIAICICRLRWSSQMQEARLAAMTASSIHEASMIRPVSAYSGKINPHEALYMGSYNRSTLGRGGALTPVSPMPMVPYVQPMHVVHAAAMAASPTLDCAAPLYAGPLDCPPLCAPMDCSATLYSGTHFSELGTRQGT